MAHELILIVEDESDIAELVSVNLERVGYRTEVVHSGEAALAKVEALRPALVVLDLMLPGLNGLEVCKRIKAADKTAAIPVLMLTARTEESEIITGFEAGADDYVTKPFSPRVLVARVKTLLKRELGNTEQRRGDRISLHGIDIDVSRHEVFVDGTKVHLSATEFSILEFLARNSGWVFSRNQIIDAVKGKDYPVTERSVDVQILGLRKKLGARGDLIQTVRGVGYRLAGV